MAIPSVEIGERSALTGMRVAIWPLIVKEHAMPITLIEMCNFAWALFAFATLVLKVVEVARSK